MASAVTQQISIRRFESAEWRTYKALRLCSLEDSPDAFASTLDRELARPDTVWAERLQNAVGSGQNCVLIAEVEGTPSGLVWAKVDATDPVSVNLFQMWVTPEARGRGVGNALLQAALDWARQYGARSVKLGVTCGDTAALRLYQRAGFVALGATEPIREGNAVLIQNIELVFANNALAN